MPEPLQQVNASLPAALVAFIQRQAAQTVRTMGVFPGENISIGKGQRRRARLQENDTCVRQFRPQR